jgi:hypothetical protein
MPAAVASAIARTMAASSIEATVTAAAAIGLKPTAGQGAGSLRFVYQAPDRLETKGAGGEDIWIGTAHYIHLSSSLPSSLPNPAGQGPPVSLNPTGWAEFIQPTQPAAVIQDMIFWPLRLRVQRAQVVTGSGPTFSFRLRITAAPATLDAWGTIRLAGGCVASIDMSSIVRIEPGTPPDGGTVPPMQQPATLHVTYSHCNRAPPVNPPPASEVTVEPLHTGAPAPAATPPVGAI